MPVFIITYLILLLSSPQTSTSQKLDILGKWKVKDVKIEVKEIPDLVPISITYMEKFIRSHSYEFLPEEELRVYNSLIPEGVQGMWLIKDGLIQLFYEINTQVISEMYRVENQQANIMEFVQDEAIWKHNKIFIRIRLKKE